MPTSSTSATFEKKAVCLPVPKALSKNEKSSSFLKIESALPNNEFKKFYKRSNSTLNITTLSKVHCDSVCILYNKSDGSANVSRTQNEKDANPDRISLDRRGLTTFPIIIGENKLRLLSVQHNLICNLDGLKVQTFPTLVFLDIYDNQLENISCLDSLMNLRVLLMGKNRLRKIEGLTNLKKIEVLDFHGNQITQVTGLSSLSELKVLNLAGNQIKIIGLTDLQGLISLEELNLRRNKLKKLLGFSETPQLKKLFLSNNDLQSVEDISSLAKSVNIKEIAIDCNPVFLGGECVSFLVSYLPQLIKLNSMNITEQVKKAAMAWRRNKETTNTAFMDLTSDICLNVRREEIISNARTNWELLRSQTKCLTMKNSTNIGKTLGKNLKPDNDIILTSLPNKNLLKTKSKTNTTTTKVPSIIVDKKIIRTNSLETETSSSNTSSTEFFKLPPILVPIINKLEQKNELKMSSSLSSIGPNVDSSYSSAGFDDSSRSSSEDEEDFEDNEPTPNEPKETKESEKVEDNEIEIASNLSSTPSVSTSTIQTVNSSKENTVSTPNKSTTKNRIKSALNARITTTKLNARATTAVKPKKTASPLANKDREQGGDYLIEICGRFLNVYGQCALRFIDKPWNQSKANDVSTVKFNYINFNNIAFILNKLKVRFPNIEHFYFKETNIFALGQLNALAEVQGLTSLTIESDGNPIIEKNWESYAIYRLSHWGLKFINDKPITDEDIQLANEEYRSLGDLVLLSLPDTLLQPLLNKLRLDVQHKQEENVKNWLLSADPALRNVVSKEALQWRKGSGSQDETAMKQRAKILISGLIDDMCNTVNKLRLLDKEWPNILHEFIRNTLVDYTQLDIYMKQKIQELNKF